MTEPKGYQEAFAALQPFFKVYNTYSLESWRIVLRELLQQTYPCENPECENGLVATASHLGVGKCPDCKGTGKGGKVLAVRAKNQEPLEGVELNLVRVVEE